MVHNKGRVLWFAFPVCACCTFAISMLSKEVDGFQLMHPMDTWRKIMIYLDITMWITGVLSTTGFCVFAVSEDDDKTPAKEEQESSKVPYYIALGFAAIIYLFIVAALTFGGSGLLYMMVHMLAFTGAANPLGILATLVAACALILAPVVCHDSFYFDDPLFWGWAVLDSYRTGFRERRAAVGEKCSMARRQWGAWRAAASGALWEVQLTRYEQDEVKAMAAMEGGRPAEVKSTYGAADTATNGEGDTAHMVRLHTFGEACHTEG